jgi:hypothetical protein
MYLIIHNTSTDRRWISGIFKERHRAIAYMESIPHDIKPPKLREFRIDSYPVFLLEAKGVEFTLYKEVDIDEYINNIILDDGEDEDRLYANIYYLEEDWQSSRPGTDSMGAIRHTHLDDRAVLEVRDSGIASRF